MPALLARADPTMAEFERWVRQRLSEPLRISDAARDLGISERTLQRTTASVVGMSPLALHSSGAPRRGHIPAP